MKLEDIQKQLLKQKDPLAYLEKLLKKTKDKKLIDEIKKLIEKLKTLQKQELPKQKLENIIRYAPRIPIEEEEPTRIQRTTITRALPSIALEVPEKQQEDYGINPKKADYDISTEKIRHNLQESHLISEHGFTSSTETRNLIDQKMGEYHIQETKQYSFREQPDLAQFEHVQHDTTGLTSIEKEILKKKKKPELDYK